MASHADSGVRCCAPHATLPDDDNRSCIMCHTCSQFIRPKDMDKECPGPRTAEQIAADSAAMEQRLLSWAKGLRSAH